jgi:hypothetical protein
MGSRALIIRFHINLTFDLLKIEFHKKNYFLFMKLLRSNKLVGKTNMLAQVNLSFFFCSFFIFLFHHLIIVGWKLNFLIFFDLLYIGLS